MNEHGKGLVYELEVGSQVVESVTSLIKHVFVILP